jgi:hypothetical protein
METVAQTQTQNKPHYSIPSIIAIAAAIVSLFVRPGTGLLLAIIAILFGIFGFGLSLHPKIRGGLLSLLSMMLACIGIVLALLRAIFRL